MVDIPRSEKEIIPEGELGQSGAFAEKAIPVAETLTAAEDSETRKIEEIQDGLRKPSGVEDSPISRDQPPKPIFKGSEVFDEAETQNRRREMLEDIVNGKSEGIFDPEKMMSDVLGDSK